MNANCAIGQIQGGGLCNLVGLLANHRLADGAPFRSRP